MTAALLTVSAVSHSFGGLRAVDSTSFEVPKGKITSLIGPNGAGKTTIFNIISGFLSAQAGSITFEGKEIQNLAPHKIACLGIGRTFQAPRIYLNMTVVENVMVGIRQRGEGLLGALVRDRSTRDDLRSARRLSEEILSTVGLFDRRDELAQSLSVGEQRYLSIARTLVSNPKLILMDEPTVGLDGAALARFTSTLKEIVASGRTTLLLVEHNMDVVLSISDQIVLMIQGAAVMSGPPDQVKASASMAEAYLGKAHVT